MLMNRLYTLFLGRPVGWVILILASFALIFSLQAGHGMAAWVEQTSPLATSAFTVVSPLATPTPTPTPTATSPIPPTSEPPANLQSWPTPTPTPYPAPVQAAIDFLTNDATLSVTNPEPFVRILVDDPTTDSEVTVMRLRDPATGVDYWLRFDSEGGAAFLPDFSEEAQGIVAAAEKVAASDLSTSQSFYLPFPFTRQIIWSGRISNAKSGVESRVNLNLAGAEVDLEAVNVAEAEAIAEYCGVMDVTLCLEILYAPEGAESNAVLIMQEDFDPAEIVAFLDEQGILYRQGEDDEFYFRMGNDALRTLAQMEGAKNLYKDFPDELRPLDTNLIIGLIEQSGALSLTLESQKEYPLLTYRVEATLEQVEVTQTQSITLQTRIDGIFAPASGLSLASPASGVLALGQRSGRYNLTFAYSDPDRELDLLDTYLLIVSDGRVVIRPSVNLFTWPKYATWLRLPANAIWFVVYARNTALTDSITPEDFADKAAAFYNDIADARARELNLAEGVYINDLFVPPWPTWQIPDGDLTRIPVNENQAHLFQWPDVRYFTYTGALSDVEEIITEHCVDEVAIVGYTASGDVLDVCQR